MKVSKNSAGDTFVSLLGNRVILARIQPMWFGVIPGCYSLSISDGDPESDEALLVEVNKSRMLVKCFRRTVAEVRWG